MSEISFGSDRLTFSDAPVRSIRGYNTETTFIIQRNDASLSNPSEEIMGTVQDTGIERAEGVITGMVTGALSSTNSARNFIRNAMIRPQVSTSRRYGMMGFQIDQLPEWNLSASADRGAVITRGEVRNSGDQRTKVEFILNIRISGVRGTAPNYRWG